MGNKKLALLYILRILQEDSDADHPLTQSDIADRLEQRYGIVLERKAISRNLSLLREAGYEVESHPKGNFLDERPFENAELRLMIDGVLSSRYITEKQAKNLAERIAALSNKYFRSRVKHIHLLSNHDKSNNQAVFYALEVFDEAIEAGRKVSFSYAHFAREDGTYPAGRNRVTVSPIQLVVKNQFYYLIAATEVEALRHLTDGEDSYPTIGSYRLDRIANPIIEEEAVVDPKRLAKYGQETDIKALLSANPYMDFTWNKPCRASFLCAPHDLDLVFDNLGTNLKVQPAKETSSDRFAKFDTAFGKRIFTLDMVKVTLSISISDLVEFACRYPEKIFILTPTAARRRQEQLYTTHMQVAEKILENYENS